MMARYTGFAFCPVEFREMSIGLSLSRRGVARCMQHVVVDRPVRSMACNSSRRHDQWKNLHDSSWLARTSAASHRHRDAPSPNREHRNCGDHRPRSIAKPPRHPYHSALRAADVAQSDRASVYETEGCRFESCHLRWSRPGDRARGGFHFCVLRSAAPSNRTNAAVAR
jgi:hypothetical protein